MNVIFFSKREGLARQLNLAHPVTLGILAVLVLGILAQPSRWACNSAKAAVAAWPAVNRLVGLRFSPTRNTRLLSSKNA